MIREAELEFGRGMTVITGETGAGKSIMLGALSLVLGTRADSRVAGDSGKSYVEASFEEVDPAMRPILESHDIEWIESDSGRGGDVVIKREINAKGRSRVFINDTAVTLATLAEIGPKLVEIHSQHANAKLNDPLEQLRVIDLMSGDIDELADYKEKFREFAGLKHRIDALRRHNEELRRNEALLRMQYEELDALKPKEGELAEIEKRYEMLSDADEIKERVGHLSALLGDSEDGLVSRLSEARQLIGQIDLNLFGSDVVSADLADRMETLYTELVDISETVEDMNSGIDTDPRTLDALSARMDAYYRAIKRFHVGNGDELTLLYQRIATELSGLEDEDGNVADLEREARKVARELKEKASVLTAMRSRAGEAFSRKIIEVCSVLGMPNLRFEVKINPAKLTSSGGDNVEFYSAFNKNSDLRPVGDTASGGEMSRLMLGLKSVIAEKMQLPTVIFDEVDTGVSGEIAERMGRMMRKMGGQMQVMAITHLPQVASQGTAHYKVSKHDESDNTVTQVKQLGTEERVLEIAAMISGSEITDAAIENAKALLETE